MNHEQQPKPNQNVHRQPQHEGQRTSGGGWVNRLKDIVTTLKLADSPEIAAVVQMIMMKGDERNAEKWCRMLSPYYTRQLLIPDLWLSNERGLLDGEFLVGHLPNGSRFGLDRSDLTRHVVVVGTTGSGKTTVGTNLICQYADKGVCVFLFDRKGDGDHLIRHRNVDVLKTDEFAFNFLQPMGTLCSIAAHRNLFAKLWSDQMQAMLRGHAILSRALDYTYQKFNVYDRWRSWDWTKMVFPSFEDLHETLRNQEMRSEFRGQGFESLKSLQDKTRSVMTEFGRMVQCRRGIDLIGRFYRPGRVLSLNVSDVSIEYQNLLVSALFSQLVQYFSAHGPRDGTLTVVVAIEEGKGFLSREAENPTLIDLISQSREFGVGLQVMDQIPSSLSQGLMANAGTLVAFRLTDGNDIRRVGISMSATLQQMQEHLKPGEAIVKSGKCKDLHKITIPFTPRDKFVPHDELRRLMQERIEILHRDVIRQEPPTKAHAEESFEQKFMAAVLKDFERPLSKIYEELQISESAGFRTKEKLIAKGLITQVDTSLGGGGKKRASFAIPSPELLPPQQGKGGALHRHFQNLIAEGGKKRGWKAQIEVGDVDVSLEKDGVRIGVQLSITSRAASEIAATPKVLEKHDKCVIAFVSRKSLEKTRSLLPKPVAENVVLCMTNELPEIIK